MHNDFFAPRSYYEKPDIEAGYFDEFLSESKLNTVREFLEDLLDMIYGKKPLDRDQIDFDVDELCCALKITRPNAEIVI